MGSTSDGQPACPTCSTPGTRTSTVVSPLDARGTTTLSLRAGRCRHQRARAARARRWRAAGCRTRAPPPSPDPGRRARARPRSRGRRPRTKGAGLEVSALEPRAPGTRAGAPSARAPSPSATSAWCPGWWRRCRRMHADARAPSRPGEDDSSPGIATVGEMPWMRGASNTATVAALDSCPSTTTTTGTGVSRPSVAAISGISTWSRVGAAWTTRPGLSPNRTPFSDTVAPMCLPVMVTLCPRPTRAGGDRLDRRRARPAQVEEARGGGEDQHGAAGDQRDRRRPAHRTRRGAAAATSAGCAAAGGGFVPSGAIDGGGVARPAGRTGSGRGRGRRRREAAGLAFGAGGARAPVGARVGPDDRRWRRSGGGLLDEEQVVLCRRERRRIRHYRIRSRRRWLRRRLRGCGAMATAGSSMKNTSSAGVPGTAARELPPPAPQARSPSGRPCPPSDRPHDRATSAGAASANTTAGAGSSSANDGTRGGLVGHHGCRRGAPPATWHCSMTLVFARGAQPQHVAVAQRGLTAHARVVDVPPRGLRVSWTVSSPWSRESRAWMG